MADIKEKKYEKIRKKMEEDAKRNKEIEKTKAEYNLALEDKHSRLKDKHDPFSELSNNPIRDQQIEKWIEKEKQDEYKMKTIILQMKSIKRQMIAIIVAIVGLVFIILTFLRTFGYI